MLEEYDIDKLNPRPNPYIRKTKATSPYGLTMRFWNISNPYRKILIFRIKRLSIHF